ncbi:MAG: sucrose phosphorylase [Candidatus Azotimanducaceae bacterium]|jgi:sucrose phosphorylase
MQELMTKLHQTLTAQIEFIYPQHDSEILINQLLETFDISHHCEEPRPHDNKWSERDIIAITYGGSIEKEGEKNLRTLHRFFNQHFSDIITILHILPFYPYSSDDGFSVINYKQVNESLGDWDDIKAIANDYNLMADLVINHCSSRSQWFEAYKQNQIPERDYFVTVDPSEDLSGVVRPRTSPLLREVETLEGVKNVWCTFSHDQVDLNFANPAVLLEFVDIISFYLARGINVFRLDAVAFLWKEIGTNCLNLPQTHEIIRLLRTLIEHRSPNALLITETNIPNRENLAYFGNANEAHIIYNFALPPLLLHGLLSGNNHYLNNWLMSMPPARDGTTYLNFIASHDGIGLRPIEGILDEAEISQMVKTMQSFGGQISWRNLNQDEVRAYEVNISLIDALKGTLAGEDDFQLSRFMAAHIIMMGLDGIPAFYIQSLLGTPNDQERLELTANNRAINRHVWNHNLLNQHLGDPTSIHSQVLGQMKHVIGLRKRQPAFHPNATQYTLHLGEGIFSFWRQSRRREQSIFCIHNITNQAIDFSLTSVNLIDTQRWIDLFTGTYFDDLTALTTLAPYQCLWLTNRSFSSMIER